LNDNFLKWLGSFCLGGRATLAMATTTAGTCLDFLWTAALTTTMTTPRTGYRVVVRMMVAIVVVVVGTETMAAPVNCNAGEPLFAQRTGIFGIGPLHDAMGTKFVHTM
jgi:hypothetical protein